MTRRRLALLAAALAALAALAPAVAAAATLDEAIALALKHDAGLKRVGAEQAAARARVTEAEAGLLPTLTLQAQISDAPTAYGHFFGFPDQTLQPRSAEIELRQPIFNGGGAGAAVRAAKAGEASAADVVLGAKLTLIADVAAAFEEVRVSDQTVRLEQSQVTELSLVAQQAARRFQDGAIPRTDVDQAAARLAGARADLARAEGDLAVAQARYAELVGEPPDDLAPADAPPTGPGDIDEAVAQAQARNPGLAAAEAAARSADERVRQAEAERAPRIDLVAGGSSIRDQFLPGYRADAASIGVEGRWTLFSGGLVSGKISEAAAERSAAEASLSQNREAVREAAIEAWHGLATARAVRVAAEAQAASADSALVSLREEVRVGEKPTLDLLDAEREALADHIGALRAEAAVVVAGYRLKAVVGDDR